MEQQDSSFHVTHPVPESGLVWKRQMPSTTAPNQRGASSKQIVTVGDMIQSIGSSAVVSGSHVGLHPNAMLFISRDGQGKPVERDQEVRRNTVLTSKLPDQQQIQQPGLPFGQFAGGVITPPQHVIQISEMNRERSNHHSRGRSAFQAAIETSGPEIQLESSKRLSPGDERNLRPPPASRRGIPTNVSLKYQLLAYQYESQKRQEKAHVDKPVSTEIELDTKEDNSSSKMKIDKPVSVSDSETTSEKEEEEDNQANKLKAGDEVGEKSTPIDLAGNSSSTSSIPRTSAVHSQEKESTGSKTRVRRESLTLLPKSTEQEKNTPYSDISDNSDIDEPLPPPSSSSAIPPTKDGEKVTSGLPMQQNSFQSTRVLASMNGFMQMSTLNSGKEQKPPSQEVIGQLARLPSFNSLDQLSSKLQSTGEELGKESSSATSNTQSSSKEQLRKQRSDKYNIMFDSQSMSLKDTREKPSLSTPANSMRPSLMSSGTNFHGARVSAPGQNQRHGMAERNSLPCNANSSTTADGHSRPSSQISGLNSENPFHLTSIGSMEDGGSKTGSSHSLGNNKRGGGIPTSKSLSSDHKMTKYSMVSMFQRSDGPKSVSDHRMSMSARPRSLTPSKSMKPPGRSPSPTIATITASFPSSNKQQISDQRAKLPSFDSSPAHFIPSQGTATIAWGDQSKRDDGRHNSDSSGSGGLISTHRRLPKRSKKHQRAEPLSGLKPPELQQTRDREHGNFIIGNMQNAKQPETPALGPIPNFSLANFQPISPGVVETHNVPGHHVQQQQQQQQQHLKDVIGSGAGVVAIQKQPPPSKGFGPVPPTIAGPQAGSITHLLSAVDGSNKKSMQRQVPSSTPPIQRGPSSKQVVAVGDMIQNIGSSAVVSGSHVGLHPNAMLSSISGSGPGKPVERDQEVREAPRRKSDDAILTNKMPDQQQIQQPGLPFGQFAGGVITPPQHVIQISEMKRKRSNHHSRGGSAFQATIEGGNGHPREHRKRPGPEIQLESSKRSPPSDERNLRPPPASMRLPSKGIPATVHQFMSPFMESEEAKDNKLKEQFPPGFDYDPNLPMPLKYRLLAYQNKSQKRQEKARMDKPSSKHSIHQSPSSQRQQQPQDHHSEPNEHLPLPQHMMSASLHRSSLHQTTPPPRVPIPTGVLSSKSYSRTPSHLPAGSSGSSSNSGSHSFPSQHHSGGGASGIILQVGGPTHMVKLEPGDDRHKLMQRGGGTKSPILSQKLQSGSQKQPAPQQSSSSSSSRKPQPSSVKHLEPAPIHVKNEGEPMAWQYSLMPIQASSASQFMLVPTAHMGPWMAVASVTSDHESVKSSGSSSSSSLRQRESGGKGGVEIVNAHSHGGAGSHHLFGHHSPSPRSTTRRETSSLSSSSEHKSSFSPGHHVHPYSSSRPPTSTPSHVSHSAHHPHQHGQDRGGGRDREREYSREWIGHSSFSGYHSEHEHEKGWKRERERERECEREQREREREREQEREREIEQRERKQEKEVERAMEEHFKLVQMASIAQVQLQIHDNFGLMTKDHIKATLQAIERKGALSHTIVHGVFVGPARSGKNCLMENLLGQIPSFKSPSTGVAEAVVQVQVEKLITVVATVDKGSKWSKIDDNDEVIRLISVHSDPRNIQYEQQDGMVNETCARVRPFIPNLSKNHNSDTPLEILTRAIENKGLDALQKYFDTSWSLYLSNTGGQIEFQEILPLLVSGPCVFFYTFRIDRDLNEHYTIEYELQDGTKSELYKSTLTTIEGIQQSLASIAAMGIFVYRGREKKEVQLRPKVFFVGTHKDLLPSSLAETIITEKDRCLQESTSQFVDIIEFASSSQMIFTVDNFSGDKPAFQKIRSAVECAVERHEFEMVCPSHWLILSFALRRFNQEIVSYEECFKVAKQCGIVDKKELNDALHFIHTKMGVIRYFPFEYIKEFVIIQPQILYDKITELIVKTFTFENAHKSQVDQFQENGIFSLEEFERICRMKGDVHIKALGFAKLLEKLRIITPFKQDGDFETKYFLHCVLSHAAEAKKQLETQSLEIPPLAITFECGHFPKGLGGALINYLMTNEMKSNFQWKLDPNGIFRDQVSFDVGPYDTVVLKILATHLLVACIPNCEFHDRGECQIEDICVDVRKAIEAGIKQVASDINYIYSKIEPSLTFLCSCSKHPSPHLAKEMYFHNDKPCTLCCGEPRKRYPLPQGYDKWFPTTKHETQGSAVVCVHRLTEHHLTKLLDHLTKHASHWREIGMQLGFLQSELDNIEARPLLQFTAPTSWLVEMLTKWLQWAPGDSQGSTSFATLETLTAALVRAGFAATADDLKSLN